MQDAAQNGFTAVLVDHSAHLKPEVAKETPPKPLSGDAFDASNSPLATAISAYAREQLPRETFNHSMRVYCYGLALLPYLSSPFHTLSHETWLLACLLHDIGTPSHNMHATHMSFEFQGGMIAHSVLTTNKSTTITADAVAEAVVRHQDVGSAGKIHALGALLQMATIVDNTGSMAEFLHPQTIETVVGIWPRLGWSGCFAKVVREEGRLKPWAHTTKMGVEEFSGAIEGNKVMNKYE